MCICSSIRPGLYSVSIQCDSTCLDMIIASGSRSVCTCNAIASLASGVNGMHALTQGHLKWVNGNLLNYTRRMC